MSVVAAMVITPRREKGSGVVVDEALGRLDDAISAWVKERGDGKDMVTGWVLVTSVKHPSLPNSDGYTVDHSRGTPYHSQLGLLEAGLLEKKNTVLINTYLEMRGQ
jgi:hypothetical protein